MLCCGLPLRVIIAPRSSGSPRDQMANMGEATMLLSCEANLTRSLAGKNVSRL